MADEKETTNTSTDAKGNEVSNTGVPNSQLHHGFRENHENPDNGRVETRVWYHPEGVEGDGRWLSAAEWDDVNRSPLSSEVLNEDGKRRYKLVKGVTAVQADGTEEKPGDYTVTFEATGKSVTIDAQTFDLSFAPAKEIGLE